MKPMWIPATIITLMSVLSASPGKAQFIDFSKTCSYTIVGKATYSNKVRNVSQMNHGRNVSFSLPDTSRPQERWVPYPAAVGDDGGSGTTIFQNIASHLYLRTGWDHNILVLPDVDTFTLKNKNSDGYMNFQASIGNDLYMKVGWDANILAWKKTQTEDQLFKLNVASCHERPAAKKIDPKASVGPFPRMSGLNDMGINTLPAPVVLDEQVVSALLITHPGYDNKIVQLDTHPYYFLQHAQQWDSSDADDFVELTGRETQSFSIEFHRGFSRSQMEEIKQMVGHTFNADLSGEVAGVTGEDKSNNVSGKVGLDLGYTYQNQQTSVQRSEETVEEWRRVSKTLTYAPQGEQVNIRTWRLYDVFTLLDSNRKQVRSWRVLNTVRLDSYPALGGALNQMEGQIKAGL